MPAAVDILSYIVTTLGLEWIALGEGLFISETKRKGGKKSKIHKGEVSKEKREENGALRILLFCLG